MIFPMYVSRTANVTRRLLSLFRRRCRFSSKLMGINRDAVNLQRSITIDSGSTSLPVYFCRAITRLSICNPQSESRLVVSKGKKLIASPSLRWPRGTEPPPPH